MRDCREGAFAARERPRVALIEWIEPLMATGNWMPELVEMAGGVNLLGEPGQALRLHFLGGDRGE